MTAEERLDDKYGASKSWFTREEMIEAMNEHCLSVAREAVQQEISSWWETSHKHISARKEVANNILTRIESKLTEES